jgi:hypothetical protein
MFEDRQARAGRSVARARLAATEARLRQLDVRPLEVFAAISGARVGG